MLLADLGADVVKIESPRGEVTRGPLGAFRAYDFVNRNKRALAVDISRREGAEVVKRLARYADVWVENFRPGALERLGLGYKDLSDVNPAMIYCSISAFGQDGPYRERGGLDLVAQAMAGVMSFVGQPGGEPSSTAIPFTDLTAGTFGAVGILAAYARSQKTGKGQHVDTSLFEAGLSYTAWESGMYLTTGALPEPQGSRHRLAAPYEALRTRDRYIVVGVNSNRLWARFCDAIGEPELAREPPFDSNPGRLVSRDALQQRIETIQRRTRQRTGSQGSSRRVSPPARSIRSPRRWMTLSSRRAACSRRSANAAFSGRRSLSRTRRPRSVVGRQRWVSIRATCWPKRASTTKKSSGCWPATSWPTAQASGRPVRPPNEAAVLAATLGGERTYQTPIACATFAQLRSSCPSSRRR
jgi:crotonobetainyl-CoA:carnitine CoA-transferase CaiB-like acyl-CoA transferase